MIVLYLVLCSHLTGVCGTLRSDVTFESVQLCQESAQILLAAREEEIEEAGLKVDRIECRVPGGGIDG